jgi:kinesin family protein 5
MQESENIKIAVRFRPLNQREEGEDVSFLKIDNNNIELTNENDKSQNHKFIFDNVFNVDSNQEEVYNLVAKNAIEWFCQGYNSTIFTYGPTSSGKTHTMFGGKDDKKGIIPRSCETLFQTLKNNENISSYTLKCSFIEIYCEKIRDLLDTDKDTDSLKLRNDTNKGIYIQGLIEKFVYSSQDILQTIENGTNKRTIASTSLNSVSSRSHAVLTLKLNQVMTDGTEMFSKLHLIDLAGSENVSKSEVQGISLLEAQMINKSLSCLSNVIFALTEKGRDHIPYRDSKLTFLLQDSLGGNSRTILIATASPSISSYSETLNTLKFARRTKEIKNIPKINKNESVKDLTKIIDELRKKLFEYENKTNDIKENIVRNEKKLVDELIKKIIEEQKNVMELVKENQKYKIFYHSVKNLESVQNLKKIIEK